MKNATRKWLRKANDDLGVAYALIAAAETFHDAVCFHCQQAAEKYIKAMLCEAGLPVPRIHDLTTLAKLLAPHNSGIVRHRRRLSHLTEYAVEYRYPSKRARAKQARSAVKSAEIIQDFCRTALSL